MNKTCAKCEKTVYPIEELKCLDKVWHKGCFKCHECSMTLNMKTYKGFNKLPYCEAHIPKAKATTVAETPELKRIQENTKIQSNAVYHAEFEKSKGKFTPVVDDPESLRMKQNTKIISNVTYHGDLEKKAIMEQKRNLSGDGDQNRNGMAQPKSPTYMDELSSLPILSSLPMSSQQPSMTAYQQQQQQHHHQQYAQQTSNSSAYNSSRSSSNYRHEEQSLGHNQRQMHQQMSNVQHQQQREQQQQMREQQMREQMIREQQHREQQALMQQQHLQKQQQQQQHIQHGSTGNPSPYSSRGQPTVIYSSDIGAVNANASRKVGSIVDYDPLNNYYGSLDPQRAPQSGRAPSAGTGHLSYGHPGNMGPSRGHVNQPLPPVQSHGLCYRALYDYEAQDVDEVSFVDGDLIVDCTPVDEGWLTGSIQRTGKRGMLPANYVSPAN